MKPQDKLVWIAQEGRGFYPVQERDQYDEAYWQKLVGMADTSIGRALLQARLDLVNKYCPNEPVVDFGIGSGAFINGRGSAVTGGYDVNPRAIQWLIEKGLWRDPFFRQSENMTFWDSLEHIEHPEIVLGRVTKHAFVSMPVFSDRDHVLRSKHFRPSEHFHYFTPEGFRNWMSSEGFQCIEESRVETELGREDISTFVFKRVQAHSEAQRGASRRLLRSVVSHMDRNNSRGTNSSIEAHLPTLHLLAREYGHGTVIECGVGWGASTMALLGGALAGKSRLWSYDTDTMTRKRALDMVGTDNPARKSWKFTKLDSVEAASLWDDGSVGLFFLDTSHRFSATVAELNAWLPKMRADGVICGHDYFLDGGMSEASGVKRAVLQFRDANKHTLEVLPHDHGLFILWPPALR